jgi:hypothetical protein
MGNSTQHEDAKATWDLLKPANETRNDTCATTKEYNTATAKNWSRKTIHQFAETGPRNENTNPTNNIERFLCHYESDFEDCVKSDKWKKREEKIQFPSAYLAPIVVAER